MRVYHKCNPNPWGINSQAKEISKLGGRLPTLAEMIKKWDGQPSKPGSACSKSAAALKSGKLGYNCKSGGLMGQTLADVVKKKRLTVALDKGDWLKVEHFPSPLGQSGASIFKSLKQVNPKMLAKLASSKLETRRTIPTASALQKEEQRLRDNSETSEDNGGGHLADDEAEDVFEDDVEAILGPRTEEDSIGEQQSFMTGTAGGILLCCLNSSI